MTLPTLTVPKYRIKVPSSGEMISYRPFLVKEEKILLIALEGQEYNAISNAMKHIVDECTYNKLDIDNIPSFDVSYLFINIRAKSVGETSEPLIKCSKCDFQNTVEVDLTKLKVKFDKKHTNKISLGNDIGIVMKYPTLKSDDKNETVELGINMISECVELIYNGDTIHKANEYTTEELATFIEGLTHKQFELILHFFDTMPKLSCDIKFKCSNCEHDNKIKLEGLGDFFL